MEKIRIVTDSASDIANNTREDLTILPLSIFFGETEYLDGINLSQREFYEKLIASDELPKTSLVSPFAFTEAFETAEKAGETTIVITISSKLSGTHQSAVIAAKDYPNSVFVIDSETVCIGEQILVKLALQLKDQGLSACEIVDTLEKEKKRIRILALLDTLEYLRKGGRISNVAGFVGNMLSIKPLVTIKEGAVAVLGKARGSKNGHNMLSEQVHLSGGIDFSHPFMLGYSGLTDDLLQKYIQNHAALLENQTENLPISMIGSTIGTHIGPGAIVISYFSTEPSPCE